METIDRVKLRLGITDSTQDDLLILLIEDSKDYILSSTNRNELLPTMNSLVERLAVEYYNQTITMKNNKEEGLLNVKSESHSEGGISDAITYFDLQNSGSLYVPSELKKDISKFTLCSFCTW